jgi:hypothetical protein
MSANLITRLFIELGEQASIRHQMLFGGQSGPNSYLSASALGKRGTELEGYLSGREEDDPQVKNLLASGNTFHSVIQNIFKKTSGAQSEVPVIDETLGVKGKIDMLLPGNIPVEVKTISSKGLQNLNQPLYSHASQLNFYLHARKASYGYLLYLDGEDISNTKVFTVGYQPGQLISDVMNAREYMASNPQKVSKNNYAWLASSYESGIGRGIRHSDSGAWDSIKPSVEFPGGRLNSIVQASNYGIVQSKNYVIPTMGLGIRKSQTAIGHKTKNTPRARPIIHPNRSRSYR